MYKGTKSHKTENSKMADVHNIIKIYIKYDGAKHSIKKAEIVR